MTNLTTIALDALRTIYLGKMVCYSSENFSDYSCKHSVFEISVVNVSYDVYNGDFEYAEIVVNLYTNTLTLDPWYSNS